MTLFGLSGLNLVYVQNFRSNNLILWNGSHLFKVTFSGWKKGVFWRSGAPPTHNIIKVRRCQKVRLVLRFHNRAPLYMAIFNLERVIIKKPEKSRLFWSRFCPILAKSQSCLLDFDQFFDLFSLQTFFKKKAEIPKNKKLGLNALKLRLNIRMKQNKVNLAQMGQFVQNGSKISRACAS